jgi:hypothetical protein
MCDCNSTGAQPAVARIGSGSARRRRPVLFRQQDVIRALRAARAAGLEISGYEIEPTGKIAVRVGTLDPKSKVRPSLPLLKTDLFDSAAATARGSLSLGTSGM